jgi:hypothetical protein
MREKIARAICQARIVGNQKPDDPMGVLHTTLGPEGTPPYRWQTHLREAAAVLALIAPAIEEQRFDDLVSGFKEGALAVHQNWQEDRDPDFTEAAHDYARAALSPKSEKK